MRRILLIAGHNGKGTGAKKYLDEGQETIKLRDAIAKELQSKYGVAAITDKGKDNLNLSGIVVWLKSIFHKSDLCIDIHFNASNNEAASGVESFIPLKNSEFERVAANKLVGVVSNVLQIRNRGVKIEGQSQHSKLAMLSGFDCENVLLEVCFITNKDDSDRYKRTYGFVECMAEAIYGLIKN
jgi:N-acetylmuramoyl-L-alanine amidase